MVNVLFAKFFPKKERDIILPLTKKDQFVMED